MNYSTFFLFLPLNGELKAHLSSQSVFVRAEATSSRGLATNIVACAFNCFLFIIIAVEINSGHHHAVRPLCCPWTVPECLLFLWRVLSCVCFRPGFICLAEVPSYSLPWLVWVFGSFTWSMAKGNLWHVRNVDVQNLAYFKFRFGAFLCFYFTPV